MSRLLKRVPMDFKHPIGETWPGYLNPHYVECSECHGRGTTNSRILLERITNLIMLAGSDSMKGKTHPYFTSDFSYYFDSSHLPVGKDMAELTSGLAGRSPDGLFGHDSSDGWKATDKIIHAAGLDPETWGICPRCKGKGIEPDKLTDYEAWQPTEPPEGDGYQLWEDCSEGSPVSPVFQTLDELCEWCETGATTFGSSRATKEEWKQMLSDGFVFHQEGNVIFK